jgi:hypothetical protein
LEHQLKGNSVTKTKTYMSPQRALDFPALDPELYVLWHSTGYAWPDARRSVSYLTSARLSLGPIVNGKMVYSRPGFATYTTYPDHAETFATEPEARDFLAEHENRRETPYLVNLTTVSELVRRKYNSGNDMDM